MIASEYTDPLDSAPDAVLAGIYGNNENLADHIRAGVFGFVSVVAGDLHLQPCQGLSPAMVAMIKPPSRTGGQTAGLEEGKPRAHG